MATVERSIEYDWDELPSFLGVDLWDATNERFLPPDAVERSYDRLGLEPIHTIQKEVRAVDFDPNAYEIPDSRWYGGPSLGVILRNKTGDRAKLVHPAFRDRESVETSPVEVSADAFAQQHVTERRVERIARDLEQRGRPVEFDALYARVFEEIVRETQSRLLHDDATIDRRALRSEVAARTREFGR